MLRKVESNEPGLIQRRKPVDRMQKHFQTEEVLKEQLLYGLSVKEREVAEKGIEPPRLPKGIDSLRDLERFLIHFDRARGMSVTKTARKWGLSVNQVRHIWRDPEIPERLPMHYIKNYFARLSLQMNVIVGDLISSISDRDISRASLMQKATAAGILTDKSLAMDKHISGTMDNTHHHHYHHEDREELNSEIKRLLVDLEGMEDAEEVVEKEEETKELPSSSEKQLDLFEGKEEKRIIHDEEDEHLQGVTINPRLGTKQKEAKEKYDYKYQARKEKR